MNIGQISYGKLSLKTDYLQLDICGLSAEESKEKYLKHLNSTTLDSIPILLHGDWTKKGCSENNIKERIIDYIKIIKVLSEITTIKGFTIHPPSRKKVPLDTFIDLCNQITKKTGVEVFIENRSNKTLSCSNLEEINKVLETNFMTIDIPQLYISLGYNYNLLLSTLDSLKWENIKEIHLANLVKEPKNTYVGRQLEDEKGVFNIKNFKKYLQKVDYVTLEILGGIKIFEKNKDYLLSI